MDTPLLFTTIISTGLMAGLFYGWAVSVIPGTLRVADRTYVDTMQSINRAIINPLFVVPFMGTTVLLAVTSFVHLADDQVQRGWLLAAATAVYTIGLLGVTIGRNIPLNDRLDRFGLAEAGSAEVAVERRRYESSWNSWHSIRTVAAVVAFALTIGAAVSG